MRRPERSTAARTVRPRRWLLASGLAGAGLLVWPVPGLGAAEPSIRYSGTASALAAEFVTDSSPSLTAPIDRPAVAVIASASSAYDQSGAITAGAAVYDPGATVAGGPTLLCEQFLPCPVTPPDYPLAVSASYPTRPEQSTPGADTPVGGPDSPLQVTPTGARASAAPDAASGSVTVERLRAAPSAGLITIGSASATSEQRADGPALVVSAQSRLSDVDVAGVLHLDSVATRSMLRLQPGRAPVREQSVTVEGATLLGQSVALDSDGLHVAGTDAGNPVADAERALADVLADRGVQVALVRPVEPDGSPDGVARASAYGVLVQFTREVSGVPDVPGPPVPGLPGVPSLNRTYTGTALLGASTAQAFEVQPLSLPVPELLSPATPLAAAPGAAPARPDLPALPVPPPPGPAAAPVPPQPAGLAAPASSAASGGTGYQVVGLTADQVRLVYLALAGTAAAMLVAGRAPRALRALSRRISR